MPSTSVGFFPVQPMHHSFCADSLISASLEYVENAVYAYFLGFDSFLLVLVYINIVNMHVSLGFN